MRKWSLGQVMKFAWSCASSKRQTWCSIPEPKLFHYIALTSLFKWQRAETWSQIIISLISLHRFYIFLTEYIGGLMVQRYFPRLMQKTKLNWIALKKMIFLLSPSLHWEIIAFFFYHPKYTLQCGKHGVKNRISGNCTKLKLNHHVW